MRSSSVLDSLACRVRAKWSLLHRCDFTENEHGGKCTYQARLGYEFTSNSGDHSLTVGDKAAMLALVEEAWGRNDGYRSIQ
ncbi:hypothetical protein AAVH_20782 [Aphelenchoides avenae]|nr:hypothetical protein AAVH_20782 [Aphelenchus avenae]